MKCPNCQFENAGDSLPKFLPDKILTSRSSIEGERKLVTVLFAHVVNYTSMAEKLDPERVHQIVDGCFKILMDEIHRYERTIVAQFEPGDLNKRRCSRFTRQQETPRACWHIELSSRSFQEANSAVVSVLSGTIGLWDRNARHLRALRQLRGKIGE